jgi:hypothetical protein
MVPEARERMQFLRLNQADKVRDVHRYRKDRRRRIPQRRCRDGSNLLHMTQEVLTRSVEPEGMKDAYDRDWRS